MRKHYTPDERRALAALAGTNEQYLYQCLTGRREMGAQQAVSVERATGGAVKRWDVCSRTWHLIWPELIGAEGAPQLVCEAA